MKSNGSQRGSQTPRKGHMINVRGPEIMNKFSGNAKRNYFLTSVTTVFLLIVVVVFSLSCRRYQPLSEPLSEAGLYFLFPLFD